LKKSHIIWIGISFLAFLVILFFILLYIYGFSISKPDYDAEYFTQEHIEKYSSPEAAFNHHVKALISGDAEYYQEGLGRRMREWELKMFKPYEGQRPKIVSIEEDKDSAYIVTDNNWGQFFEKVKGRWIFTPEDWGVNIRAFFRIFR